MSVFRTGKEGTELDDLWHEAPWISPVFFWAKDAMFTSVYAVFTKFFLSLLFDLLTLAVCFALRQEEMIEEISKLSLQGGLEQAVNVLAAGRSSSARPTWPTEIQCDGWFSGGTNAGSGITTQITTCEDHSVICGTLDWDPLWSPCKLFLKLFP